MKTHTTPIEILDEDIPYDSEDTWPGASAHPDDFGIDSENEADDAWSEPTGPHSDHIPGRAIARRAALIASLIAVGVLVGLAIRPATPTPRSAPRQIARPHTATHLAQLTPTVIAGRATPPTSAAAPASGPRPTVTSRAISRRTAHRRSPHTAVTGTPRPSQPLPVDLPRVAPADPAPVPAPVSRAPVTTMAAGPVRSSPGRRARPAAAEVSAAARQFGFER